MVEKFEVLIDIKTTGADVTSKAFEELRKKTGANIKQMADQKKSMIEMRGNMLSLMFAGMALQRMFGGQISRVAELTGQQSIIDAFFTIALVKPMIKITELMAEILGWFAELPKSVQSAVGIAMIALTGAGGLLAALMSIKLTMAAIGIEAALTGKTIATELTAGGVAGGTGLIEGIAGALGIESATLIAGLWTIAGAVSIYIALSVWDDLKKLNEELDKLQKERIITIKNTGIDPGKKTSAERLATGEVGMETLTGMIPGLPRIGQTSPPKPKSTWETIFGKLPSSYATDQMTYEDSMAEYEWKQKNRVNIYTTQNLNLNLGNNVS